MSSIFEKFSSPVKKIEAEDNKVETPAHLRIFGEKMISLFCKKFAIQGLDSIKEFKKENPEEKFIISSSHLHNLDVPAVLKVFGKDFNLQVTGESVLLEKMQYLGHQFLINLAGRDNFTPLDYKEDKTGKFGSFNPQNFQEIQERMSIGKTPWIASAPMSLDGTMKKASIGPIYLAAKTGAAIIPTALGVSGGSVNLEGTKETLKNFFHRSSAIYHVGTPFKIPAIDVSIIDRVLDKKARGEAITREELAMFTETHRQLKEQANLLAQTISAMLPEEKRGYYAFSDKPERED